MTFARDGAELFPAAIDASEIDALKGTLAALPQDEAGVRIYGIAPLRPLLAASSPIGAIAASVLGTLFAPSCLTRIPQ